MGAQVCVRVRQQEKEKQEKQTGRLDLWSSEDGWDRNSGCECDCVGDSTARLQHSARLCICGSVFGRVFGSIFSTFWGFRGWQDARHEGHWARAVGAWRARALGAEHRDKSLEGSKTALLARARGLQLLCRGTAHCCGRILLGILAPGAWGHGAFVEHIAGTAACSAAECIGGDVLAQQHGTWCSARPRRHRRTHFGEVSPSRKTKKRR